MNHLEEKTAPRPRTRNEGTASRPEPRDWKSQTHYEWFLGERLPGFPPPSPCGQGEGARVPSELRRNGYQTPAETASAGRRRRRRTVSALA